MMSKKIIFTNGLIDLANLDWVLKLYLKLMTFLLQLIELLIPYQQFLKKEYLIKMVNGWMVGSLEEKELKGMTI